MGVKGLFQFLKPYEIERRLDMAVKDRIVGVDLFWFIHHSKGDFFVFQDYLTPILRHAARVHCVLDGAPPQGTKEERKEKRQKREKAKEVLCQLDEAPSTIEFHTVKEQLRRQAWYPTKEYISYVKHWLQGEGAILHQASEDADSKLIELEKTGWIDLIVSNDSDLLTFGASHLLRIYCPEEAGEYHLSELCKALQLTLREWMDFMTLCRYMKKADILMAYSFIRIYKDIDYALEKYNQLTSENNLPEEQNGIEWV